MIPTHLSGQPYNVRREISNEHFVMDFPDRVWRLTMVFWSHDSQGVVLSRNKDHS